MAWGRPEHCQKQIKIQLPAALRHPLEGSLAFRTTLLLHLGTFPPFVSLLKFLNAAAFVYFTGFGIFYMGERVTQNSI